MHEQRVIRPCTNDTHLDPVVDSPSRKGVDAVEGFAGIKVVDRPFTVDRKRCLIQGNVHVAPPDA